MLLGLFLQTRNVKFLEPVLMGLLLVFFYRPRLLALEKLPVDVNLYMTLKKSHLIRLFFAVDKTEAQMAVFTSLPLESKIPLASEGVSHLDRMVDFRLLRLCGYAAYKYRPS